jgi:exonuclease III
MKIATFNVNNVRRRLPNLLDWMRDTSPDVVCLQELKATDAEFPVAEIRGAGYEAIWRGQKTWNGVAKLAWLRRLSAHAAELLAARVPVVLAGDFNVVPTDRDIYPSKSWAEDALVQPASRAAYADLVQQGWLDAIRSLNPTEPMYTFWHYLRNRWERNAGLRIDHLICWARGRCWSSTAIRSRTVPITRCPRAFSRKTAKGAARSWASPIPAAPLRCGATASGSCRMGHLGRAYGKAREISRLPERSGV